jgi:hypothetical protein
MVLLPLVAAHAEVEDATVRAVSWREYPISSEETRMSAA